MADKIRCDVCGDYDDATRMNYGEISDKITCGDCVDNNNKERTMKEKLRYVDFETDVLSIGGFEEKAKDFYDYITDSDMYQEALELLVTETKELVGIKNTDLIDDDDVRGWFNSAVETVLAKQLAAQFEAGQENAEDLKSCSVCCKLGIKKTCKECETELIELESKMDALKEKYGRPDVRKLG